MNQITRYLTVVILILQAPTYLANLHAQLPASAFALKGIYFQISSTIILIAGTMFVMWLGEKITDKGIGNGISLIIMVGIIARLPFALTAEFFQRAEEMAGGLVMFLVEMVILFIVFVLSILLVQGTRRIPVQYAKRIVGNKQYGGVRQFIPLKVNAAGVMPIIFAQALMFVPMMFARFNTDTTSFIAVLLQTLPDFGTISHCPADHCIYLFLHRSNHQPQSDGRGYEEERGFIPGVKRS